MSPSPLAGRNVVLGVTGGIAAYKAVDVLRQLTSRGADVRVVLTRSAERFVGPVTFSALSGANAMTELWDADDPIPHTRLGRWADAVVVVPATANFAARLAHGHANDLLTNTILATRAPVVVALAMHTEMWEKASVQRNVETMSDDGAVIVAPDDGPLAGGDSGVGRLASADTIVAAVEGVFDSGACDMTGLNVVVTAGGTREPIDPVRYIGNRSSGKMGTTIAAAARRRGANVVLITTAPSIAGGDYDVAVVETAAELCEVVLDRAMDADAVVMSAAVADFRPETIATTKIKKSEGTPQLRLEPTVDVLAELGRRKRSQFLIGFAAETNDVAAFGAAKVREKNLDLLVANLVGVPDSGFSSDTTRAYLCGSDGSIEDVGLVSKLDLAEQLCDRIVAGAPSRRGC